eukprot:SAG31_NODE_65_length_28565_cov_8.402914_3_plen_41_part_00
MRYVQQQPVQRCHLFFFVFSLLNIVEEHLIAATFASIMYV